ETIGRLDDVSISPVSFGVLNIVEQDELLHRIDEVEVAFPRNVIGLDDRHLLGQSLPLGGHYSGGRRRFFCSTVGVAQEIDCRGGLLTARFRAQGQNLPNRGEKWA